MFKKIISNLIILLPITAILVDSNVFFPFITPKIFVIRFIALLITILVTIDLFEKDEENSLNNVSSILKNNIFRSFSIFLCFVMLSTVFAFDKYKALMGDIERSEGLITHISFFAIIFGFVYAMSKNQIINLWKTIIFSSFILFFGAVVQYLNGNMRPGSYVNNPIFLSAYFVFTFTIGLILFLTRRNECKKYNNNDFILSILGVIISFSGIIITETRGTIIGIIISTIICSVILIFRLWKKMQFKHRALLSGLILIFVVTLIVGLFTPLGSKIPGLERLSATTHINIEKTARFLNIGVSLESVNPIKNGLKPILFGWGQDNYNIAWYKNYNPNIYLDDKAAFDRSHNKILDVLVMNGIFALFAYITLWYFVFKTWFKAPNYIGIPLLFWCITNFIQNLFSFESIVSYIPYFLMVAFSIWYTIHNYEKQSE